MDSRLSIDFVIYQPETQSSSIVIQSQMLNTLGQLYQSNNSVSWFTFQNKQSTF